MLPESSGEERFGRISLSFPFIPVSSPGLRPGSFAVELLCRVPAFIPSIEKLFRPFLRKRAGRARACFELRVQDGSPALYSIWEGERLSFATYRSFEVLPYLEWMVASRALAEPSRFFQLHAASLEGEGSGLLVAGPEGAGKTSLALSLIKEGLRFLGDDVALLHPLSRRLHPFPRPFHLDEGTARELSLERLIDGEFSFDYYYLKMKVIYLNPESIFPGSRAGATPLKLILFLGRRKGVLRLRPLPKRKALFFLLSHGFNPCSLGREGMEGLLRLLGRTPAFELSGGTLRQRALLVRELLQEGP